MERTLSDSQKYRAMPTNECDSDRQIDPLRGVVRAIAELNLAADGRVAEPEALGRAIEAALAVKSPTLKRQYVQRLKNRHIASGVDDP
jgi:hypothetical protein